jgi:uncharacterized protein (TIGR02996 family)
LTNLEALLRAVIAAPDDDAPRLAYADALDALAGAAAPDPRAAFIRAQILLATQRFADPAAAAGLDEAREIARRMAWLQASDLERDLGAAHAAAWASPIAAMVQGYVFDRGFIAEVTLSAANFLTHADALFERAPISFVRITDYAEVGKPLFDSPKMIRVRALSLVDNGLADADVAHLAASPYLTSLWWLDLGYNPVDLRGLRSLASSRQVRGLRFVGLEGALADPRETAGYEGYTISHLDLPTEGQALEAAYGFLPWLHFNTESALDYPPNPRRAPPRP